MALNKKILKKISEKTSDDSYQKDFIIKILTEENKGIGRYKKFYKLEISNAIDKEEKNENRER